MSIPEIPSKPELTSTSTPKSNQTPEAEMVTVSTADITPPATPPGDDSRSNHGAPNEDPMTTHIQNGVEYQSMSWWQAGMVMVAETISLGILSLPQAMSTVGVLPGLVLLLALGAMASYSGFVIGQFKQRYPHIHSMACAGEVLFGRWGGRIIGLCQYLFYVFVMGSHILTFSICMNILTNHATCTILWMVVGTLLSLLCTLPRTLKHLSYYSVASFVSIIGAVLTTMIVVSIAKPGFNGSGQASFRMWPRPDLTFVAGFLAVSNMVFAYAGHVAFFTFISELKNPNDFPKALAFLQISDISMYIITAIVIYYYAGEQIASPALNSIGLVWAKVAWGIAIPTIIIAGVVNGHVGVKFIYVRTLRHRSDDLIHQKTWKSWGLWVGMCTFSWFAAWLIAEVVPVFNDMLAITSALFASWFTFGFSGMFWIHLNLQHGDKWYLVVPRQKWNWRKTVLLFINMMQITVAAILCIVGIYASVRSMATHGSTKKPFSCKA